MTNITDNSTATPESVWAAMRESDRLLKERIAKTFRVNFPDYANHKIYLGLAIMTFYPELERTCIEQGIAVVKQVGDTVVINDTNLKFLNFNETSIKISS